MPERNGVLPLVAQSLDFTCGAACFESMFQHLRGHSRGELVFAEELGTLALGYTPPERIVELATRHGFDVQMHEGASLSELASAFAPGKVLFVTWWDEDAGHYSLVDRIDPHSVTLMDPWTARESKYNRLERDFFRRMWEQRGSRFISVSLSSTPHPTRQPDNEAH